MSSNSDFMGEYYGDGDDNAFYDQLSLAAYRDEDGGYGDGSSGSLPANTDPSVAHAVGGSPSANANADPSQVHALGGSPAEQAFRRLLGR